MFGDKKIPYIMTDLEDSRTELFWVSWKDGEVTTTLAPGENYKEVVKDKIYFLSYGTNPSKIYVMQDDSRCLMGIDTVRSIKVTLGRLIDSMQSIEKNGIPVKYKGDVEGVVCKTNMGWELIEYAQAAQFAPNSGLHIEMDDDSATLMRGRKSLYKHINEYSYKINIVKFIMTADALRFLGDDAVVVIGYDDGESPRKDYLCRVKLEPDAKIEPMRYLGNNMLVPLICIRDYMYFLVDKTTNSIYMHNVIDGKPTQGDVIKTDNFKKAIEDLIFPATVDFLNASDQANHGLKRALGDEAQHAASPILASGWPIKDETDEVKKILSDIENESKLSK